MTTTKKIIAGAGVFTILAIAAVFFYYMKSAGKLPASIKKGLKEKPKNNASTVPSPARSGHGIALVDATDKDAVKQAALKCMASKPIETQAKFSLEYDDLLKKSRAGLAKNEYWKKLQNGKLIKQKSTSIKSVYHAAALFTMQYIGGLNSSCLNSSLK